jgi:exopolysaccharide biosynthesis polyprenyl glycosylphosphotransferase
MLGKRRAEWIVRLVATDVAALALAFLAAYVLRRLLGPPLLRPAGPLGHYLWLLALIVPAWLALLAALGGYGVHWTAHSRAWLAIRAGGLGLLLLTAALFLVQESEINRSLLVLFGATSAGAVWLGRDLVLRWLRRSRRGERWARLVLIVGTGERATRLIASLRRFPEAGWLVRGCVMMGPAETERMVAGVPVVGSLEQLPELLQGERAVDEVFFAVPPDRLDQIADALEACESLGVDARVLVDVHRPEHAHAFVEELFGLPFYGFSPTVTRQGELAAKRLVDVLGASLLLLLSLPVFALIAGLIKAASPGPVLFLQERAGFHGRRFRMYKFRTMVVDAEALREQVAHLNEMDGPVFKAGADPRRTRLGRFLRRTSLDELPQLINVIRGEMSLVGPRPLPVYEASRIKGAQRRRLAMRPGITGLWQVSGRNMVDFDAWMQMDLAYVDGWSLGRDLMILLRTVPAVLRGEGAS